jgi:predicted RNA-binding protein
LVDALGDTLKETQICFLALPFGMIPVELSDVYPLSQYVSSIEPDHYVIREMLKRAKEFISKHPFEKIILLNHLDAYSPIFKRIAKVIRNCNIINALDLDDADFNKTTEEISMNIAKAKS